MSIQNLIFFGALAAIFWFLVLRPQQQRQKQHREMLERLETGDEIVTIGGIYATVVDVGERVRVALADGAELEIARPAVAQIVARADEGEAAESVSADASADAGEAEQIDAVEPGVEDVDADA